MLVFFIITVSVLCYIIVLIHYNALFSLVFSSSSRLLMSVFKAYHSGAVRNWWTHCGTAGLPSNTPHVVPGKKMIFGPRTVHAHVLILLGSKWHKRLRINALVNLLRPSEHAQKSSAALNLFSAFVPCMGVYALSREVFFLPIIVLLVLFIPSATGVSLDCGNLF